MAGRGVPLTATGLRPGLGAPPLIGTASVEFVVLYTHNSTLAWLRGT